MRVVNCIQGSQEWFEARLGRVTASQVADAVKMLSRANGKGGKAGDESETRKAYKGALIAEILTGQMDPDGYVSQEMKDGIENEPVARTEYEMRHDAFVDLVGFVIHPQIDQAGASPDGLVGTDGCIEIKCPKTHTHLKYLLDGVPPEEYVPQMNWVMACTGRQWCDFISYDSRLPHELQLFVCRLERNEEAIAKLEEGVRIFLAEVESQVAELIARFGKKILAQPKPVKAESSNEGFLTDADIDAAIAGELYD